MTDLLDRPATQRPGPAAQWRTWTPNPGVRRTLVGFVASALGALPLCTLMSDRAWLIEVWVSMLVVLVPALVLRLSRPPSAVQIWLGVLLLIPWLTVRFVRHHSLFGLPTANTLHQFSTLMTSLRYTAHDSVAPVHSTLAIRLALSLVLALVAALVDLIAVVGRHGALAGVPLLVVFSAAGSAPHRSVGWLFFLGPAVAFLLLLGLDARDERSGWGHWVAHPDGHHGSVATLTGTRIAAIVLVCAVVLPVLSPAGNTSLLGELFRQTGGGHGSGFGPGGSIDPFAELKGELDRSTTVTLAHVHVAPLGVDPSYLRVNVLTNFTGTGWTEGAHGPTEPVTSNRFDTVPVTGGSQIQTFSATIASTGMSGNPPVFAYPEAVSGVPGARWSEPDQLLVGASFHSGQTETELSDQPDPTVAQLRGIADPDKRQYAAWLALPTIPKSVHTLVNRLTASATGEYAKSIAIFDYFTNPDNGFAYSLQTAAGDSGSQLVDFLRNRIGFCQQYAAAMAVMLRLAGVPARVVLGYAHAAPNGAGDFAVTSDDAHAWVEAYFPTVGWLPFDPTPPAGIANGHAKDPPWAQRPSGPRVPTGTGSSQSASVHRTISPTRQGSSQGAAVSSTGSGGGTPTWPIPLLIVLVVAGVASIPYLTRMMRRRSRLAAGDPDALWAELRDTAVDLGYGWSTSRTPRQVVRWLAGSSTAMRASLATMAGAVERSRYSGAGGDGDPGTLVPELRSITGELRARRGRRQRVLARWWPASLQLSGRLAGRLPAVLRPARRH